MLTSKFLHRSGKGMALPPPPPLRTVQAPFDAYGSSIGNAPAPARGYLHWACGPPVRYCVRANHGTVGSRTSKSVALRRHVCSASSSRFAHGSRTPTPEGSLPAFAAGWCRRVAQPLSGPLQAGLRLLPPPLPAAASAPLARQPSRTGRRRAYHVAPLSPCGLGRASPPVVPQLRRRSSEPPDLTTYLLVQANQHLALVLCDDV